MLPVEKEKREREADRAEWQRQVAQAEATGGQARIVELEAQLSDARDGLGVLRAELAGKMCLVRLFHFDPDMC